MVKTKIVLWLENDEQRPMVMDPVMNLMVLDDMKCTVFSENPTSVSKVNKNTFRGVVGETEEKDIEPLINRLKSVLRNTLLNNVKHTYTCNIVLVFVVKMISGDTPSLSFDPELISLLNSLPARVNFDLYSREE